MRKTRLGLPSILVIVLVLGYCLILPITDDQTADVPLTIGQRGAENVVLIITGTTRFTTESASYQIAIR